jgi:hypothetical protein
MYFPAGINCSIAVWFIASNSFLNTVSLAINLARPDKHRQNHQSPLNLASFSDEQSSQESMANDSRKPLAAAPIAFSSSPLLPRS